MPLSYEIFDPADEIMAFASESSIHPDVLGEVRGYREPHAHLLGAWG